MFIQWLLAALSIPAVLFLVIRSFENPDYIVGGLVAFVTLPWWGRFLVFEKESILDLENINIYKLTLPSKRLLHKLPYVALSDGKSDILVDLISKSKKN